MKPMSDHRADQIARDHDALAIQPIEKHASQGPAITAGIARESMMPVTTRPECVCCQRQAEHGDVVEMIADFADDLRRSRSSDSFDCFFSSWTKSDIYRIDSWRTVMESRNS